MKKHCMAVLFLIAGLFHSLYGQSHTTTAAAGIQHLVYGSPDQFTPYAFCDAQPLTTAITALPNGTLPFNVNDIRITVNDRGTIVEIPLNDSEQIYGLGLQIGSFNQRGLKKRPIVNDNPLNDLGFTHGPTTFYLSNKGYGVLINTARYTTFYFGTTSKLNDDPPTASHARAVVYVTVDIPGAKGIDLYIFAGPDMRTAMQRYNLFSGGGALPAIWGLGIKYRVKADFSQSQVDAMAAYFRANHIPCDVLGLEPKWQTAAYSCSYVWNKSLFPTPGPFIDSMAKKGFHLNLWEHAFTSPQSPLFDALKTKAGDYKVWGGLVPDFADPEARKIFAGYHQREFADSGIAGFKLDECDNSNLAEGSSTWSYPELSTFPSGISGEQMHQLFGLLYQKTIYSIYKRLNRRTYLDVRASNDFASSYPAALYSDTYDHREYIRMLVNSGFAGMLWSPEVRESTSITDLIRRTQTAVLSAQTLFNSWYLQNPPWLQIDKEKNNLNEFMDSAKIVEAQIRKLLEFRMSLVPYLYNAFSDYHFKGIPPFRALVMDEPEDKNTFNISDEYLIGSSLLAAPLTAGETQRNIYLPEGTWYDFNTNQKFQGGRTYTIQPTLNQIPLFVKAGTILPLAKPLENISADSQFDITCYVYGDQTTQTSLFEDDGYTFDYEKGMYNTVYLSWKDHKGSVTRKGDFKSKPYHITGWKLVQ
jgi:alpha-D-xyloside xylohydrolase